MRRNLAAAARGGVLAGLVGAGALLLARFGLGRLYYLSTLLPAAMTALLLLAWLLHLRADGWLGGPRPERAEAARREPSGWVAFEEGLGEPVGPSPAPTTLQDLVRTLLWAALALGLASLGLYHGAGIGAHLFR